MQDLHGLRVSVPRRHVELCRSIAHTHSLWWMEVTRVKDEAKWAYWTKHIKAWQASGLSRHAYCQRERLKPTTFDYWRPLIASDHAEVNAVKQPVNGNDITLIPVTVKAAEHPVDVARDMPPESIKLNSPAGWEMQLPSNVNTRWLIDVLRQLA
jgi:hypothetical protein